LVEHGPLETKKVGANGRVWWRSTNENTTPETDRPEFDSLVDAVEEYAIFMLDPDGNVRTWNPGAERIKGYAADDILGEHFSTFYTEDDRTAQIPERNLEKAADHGSVEDEGWRVRNDGSRFWAKVTITALSDEDGTLSGFAKVTRDMTDRHEYEEQLRHERDLIERIFETVPVGAGVLSRSGEMIRANPRMRDILDLPEDGSVTVVDIDIYDTDDNWVPPEERPYAQVLETGDAVRWECQLERSTGERRWLSINAAPLNGPGDEIDQVVSAVEDITKHKKQASRLERQRDELESELDEVFQRIDDAFFALDTDWRFTYVNDQAADMVRLSAGELTGRNVWDVLPDVADGPVQEAAERAMEVQETFETELYSELLDIWVEIRGYPSQTGLSVYARDITERKEREHELKRYETIFETVSDGVYAVDDQYRFTLVNEGYAEMTGYAREDLLGSHASKVVDEDVLDLSEQHRERLRSGETDTGSVEAEIETADGDRLVVESRFTLAPSGGDFLGTVGVVRDITERIERERELTQFETLFEESKDANVIVDSDGTFRYLTPSVKTVFGYDPEELVGEVGFQYIHPDDREMAMEEFTEMLENPDYEPEIEFRFEHADGSWIVLEALARDLRDNPDIEGVVIYTRNVTERIDRERELERQREHLAALNNLNAVVRDITDAVIDQSTREEIETIVCNRLADAGSYKFAWIAEVDPHSHTIKPRIEAGVDGYLEAIPLTTAPDDPAGQGPAGRAVRTREIQVSQDAMTDPAFEPWRKYAKEFGYRSAAAIPIVHEDTLYGLLAVYADRPEAFGGEERDVISQLGEVVGHAIASIERKQALMSDEVVEIEFIASDVLDEVTSDSDREGTITFDRAVPVGEDGFLEYGTVDADAVDLVEALAERHPNIDELTIVDRTSDPIRFQLRASEPPVISVVASHGGYVQDASIQDGDLRMTVHLPPSVAASRVIDAVEETYPGVTLTTQRHITRDESSTQLHRALTEELTDRQRATLEAAVFSGYFEWPRDVSGEEIADSLGVSPPTFHQHLRKAQKKVYDSLYPAHPPAR
jgi:PAS domain S-box-containing protein